MGRGRGYSKHERIIASLLQRHLDGRNPAFRQLKLVPEGSLFHVPERGMGGGSRQNIRQGGLAPLFGWWVDLSQFAVCELGLVASGPSLHLPERGLGRAGRGPEKRWLWRETESEDIIIRLVDGILG